MATPFNEINDSVLIQELDWGTFLTEVAPKNSSCLLIILIAYINILKIKIQKLRYITIQLFQNFRNFFHPFRYFNMLRTNGFAPFTVNTGCCFTADKGNTAVVIILCKLQVIMYIEFIKCVKIS